MKNLIFAVFAAVLIVLLVNFVEAEEAAQAESSAVESTMPVPPFEPVVWKIRKGENLTRIAERYNLSIQSILESNEGGACIKNKDKIFAGCEIIIPVYPLEQIEKNAADQKVFIEKSVERAREYGRAEGSRLLYVWVLIGMVLALFLGAWLKNLTSKSQFKELELKSEDLSSKLWATEDKAKNLEVETADLRNALADANHAIQTKDEVIQGQEQTLKPLSLKLRATEEKLSVREKIIEELGSQIKEVSSQKTDAENLKLELENYRKFAPGQTYEFESRDNGPITNAFTILESQIDVDGKPFVTKIKCMQCEAIDIKPHLSECNSHYWQHFGTTKGNWPN